MEKLNDNCLCCYIKFKVPSKYKYCFECNQLSIKTTCKSLTKSNTQCKLKAKQENGFKCYFHRTKTNPVSKYKFID